MRVPRIFTAQALAPKTLVDLEPAPSHHVAKVLRMQVGRELVVFNGQGGEFPSLITAVSKKNVTIKTGNWCETHTESPLQSLLLIGVSRGERMDWVFQKATELGVREILPVFTERTEVKLQGERLEKRVERWQQVIIGACEQCGRSTLPHLHTPAAYRDAVTDCRAEARFVLHHRSERQLGDTAKPESVALLVGPEGGLSTDELALAVDKGFSPLALGPRVMRTETAPVAALAVMQFIWGDFGSEE